MAHGGDVVGRVDEAQEGEHAVVGALVPLGEGARQQAVLVEPAGVEAGCSASVSRSNARPVSAATSFSTMAGGTTRSGRFRRSCSTAVSAL